MVNSDSVEVSVRDGYAERSGRSSSGVHVQPLLVAGGGRELVNTVLSDQERRRRAQRLAEEGGKFVDADAPDGLPGSGHIGSFLSLRGSGYDGR